VQTTSKIILGIDPGTLLMGYSIIIVQGQQLQVLEMDVLKLSPRKDNYERLQIIHQKVTELIISHRPTSFAIEAPFFGKNVQSMLKLGRAQGVAIAAAIHAGLEVFEYSPKKVKQSITGNGNADKEQVWQMLQRIIPTNRVTIKYLDASDALAVAVCHHFQGNTFITQGAAGAGKKVKGWKEFLIKNPQRVQ
jgi:crossover junction endodeoxyribonuclease RuvC